jgi:thiol:disulfide interchange protein
MKKFLLVCFVLLLSVSAASAEVKFEKLTLKEAVAKAKKENKIVMVDFYTDWCSWCKVLDQKVYSDEAFGNYAGSNIICIKLDAEREGIADAQAFGVRGYPTIAFIGGDGKEIDRIVGYKPLPQFVEAVKAIKEKSTAKN